MKIHLYGVALVCGLLTTGKAWSLDDPWLQTLQAVRFVDVSRAGLKTSCAQLDTATANPRANAICANLYLAPTSTVEAAARPILKGHLSEALTREAIAFWRSKAGVALQVKILRELETGARDQLNPADLALLAKVNGTEFGRALNRFASDPAQVAAILDAIATYRALN